MFGKKKDADASAEAAPAKAAKPKKSKKKAAITKGGPGFFALHIEKMLMVIVLGAVGYVVYMGTGLKSISESNTPSSLESDANNYISQIKQDHWEAILEQEERKSIKNLRDVMQTNGGKLNQFETQTRLVRAHVPFKRWDQGEVVWDPIVGTVYEKRGDPTILAPEFLVATNVFGSVAVEVPKETPDAWEELEDAEPIKPKGSRRNDRGNQGGAGMGMGMGGPGGGYGGGGMGPGGGYGGDDNEGGMGGGMYGNATGEAAKPKRYLKASYNLGHSVGSQGGGGMGMGMGMGGGMGPGGGYGMGGYGGEGMGMGGGMGPGGGMGMGMGMGAGTGTGGGGGLGERKKDTGPKTKVASRGIFFNAITAVVPHKKMADEYKKLFENSGSFVASRDLPVYLTFEVQRADVTKNPSAVPAENQWQDITNGGEQFNLAKRKKWATKRPVGSRVPEVIDRNAVDPGLTMPIPPMLLRDYRAFSKHPLVAWSWDSKRLVDPNANQQEDEPEEEEEEDNGDDSTFLPGSQKNRRSGGGGMGMGMGMGMGGGMGPGGGYGGGGMGPGGGYGGDDDEGYGGGGYGGGMYGGGGEGMYGGGGEGMYGGGGEGMYGGGGEGMYGGGGMGGSSPSAVQPEYKMVRCFDVLPMSADVVGKVFRYRIRLVMRDPNYPESDSVPAVDPADMKDEVWARVAKVMAEDEKRLKANENALRTMLKTPWSEPSAPVRVQAPYEVFAGVVDFDGPRNFGDKYSVSMKEAEATVVVTGLHPSTGTKFAMEQKVRRGSVLNDKSDIEFIDPVSTVVKKKEDHTLNSGATIVDLLGGSPLSGYGKDDPQTASGEMMILHRDGRLQFTNDIDDLFLYRMYTFQDEVEAAAKAGKSSNAGAGGGYGGGYGGGDEGG